MKPTLYNYLKLRDIFSIPATTERARNKSVEEFWGTATPLQRRWLCQSLLSKQQLRRQGVRNGAPEEGYSQVSTKLLQKEVERSFSDTRGELFRYRGAIITFSCALEALGACFDATAWTKHKTLEEAWEGCNSKDWLLWLVYQCEPMYIIPLLQDLYRYKLLTKELIKALVDLRKVRKVITEKTKRLYRTRGC